MVLLAQGTQHSKLRKNQCLMLQLPFQCFGGQLNLLGTNGLFSEKQIIAGETNYCWIRKFQGTGVAMQESSDEGMLP